MSLTPQVTSTHCNRGHLRTEKSTRWYRAPNGKLYPACKFCESIVRNARYKADPVYRERVLAASRAWQVAQRQETGA